MRRIILNLLTAMSLLWCVSAGALWVTGWLAPRVLVTEVGQAPPPGDFRNRFLERATWVLVARGRIEIRNLWMTGPNAAAMEARFWSWERVARPSLAFDRVSNPTVWNRLGFGFMGVTPSGNYLYSHGGRSARGWTAEIPCWFFLVLGGLLPAARAAGLYRARRRVRSGCCPGCGYDLRASFDRCPECGAATPVKSAS